VAQFVNDANRIAEDIISRNKLPIICGGTGLYIDSFLNNISFVDEGFDESIRNELISRLDKEGVDALYNELLGIDREYALSLDKNNTKRVIRELELYYSVGKTMSEQLADSRKNDSPYNPLIIGLSCLDRQKLYGRINKRVDLMLEKGLVDEAREFYSNAFIRTANQAIGIKELKPYLDGLESLEASVERIKRETRRYAKRQLTWFKKNKNINWFYIDTNENYTEDAVRLVSAFIEGGE
jgi:tRNA dimethylallyltransferase